MLSAKEDPLPALKTEAVRSSKPPFCIYQTTRHSTTPHNTTVLVTAQWPFTYVSSQPQLAKQIILQTCEQTPCSILSLNTASLTDFFMAVLSPSRQMSRDSDLLDWMLCWVYSAFMFKGRAFLDYDLLRLPEPPAHNMVSHPTTAKPQQYCWQNYKHFLYNPLNPQMIPWSYDMNIRIQTAHDCMKISVN